MSTRSLLTLILGVCAAILLSGCSSSATGESATPTDTGLKITANSGTAAGVTELTEEQLAERDRDLASTANGEPAKPLIASLYLDLIKMKPDETAEASADSEHMFVVTVVADVAGSLTITGTPAKLELQAHNIGSLAYRFDRAGTYQIVFTSASGAARTVATLAVA